jgi:hypothetical protein
MYENDNEYTDHSTGWYPIPKSHLVEWRKKLCFPNKKMYYDEYLDFIGLKELTNFIIKTPGSVMLGCDCGTCYPSALKFFNENLYLWNRVIVKDIKIENNDKKYQYLKSVGLDNPNEIDNSVALIIASEHGHLEMVKYFKEQGGDIKAKNNKAVRHACKYGHLKVVEYLVENGADITDDDNFCIKWSCRNRHAEIVYYLASILYPFKFESHG